MKKPNTMIFVDAENISPYCVNRINHELSKIGKVFEKRYYAMQKDPPTDSWKTAIKSGYKPILMSGKREKNKIDNKIIKDAKKVVATNKSIDIFVLASRDGDYAELANYLRNHNKRVVVLAPDNISNKLKNACNETRII